MFSSDSVKLLLSNNIACSQKAPQYLAEVSGGEIICISDCIRAWGCSGQHWMVSNCSNREY